MKRLMQGLKTNYIVRVFFWLIYLAAALLFLKNYEIWFPGKAGFSERVSTYIWVSVVATAPVLLCVPVYVERVFKGIRLTAIEFLFPYYIVIGWALSFMLFRRGTLANWFGEIMILAPMVAIMMIYSKFGLELYKKKSFVKARYMFLVGAVVICLTRLLIPSIPE